jgi:hypothetical protein
MNNRWETGAGAIAQWGSSAPYHTKLRIIGAFIDTRCNEFIPEKKSVIVPETFMSSDGHRRLTNSSADGFTATNLNR